MSSSSPTVEQQIQDDLSTLHCFKAYDVYRLFQERWKQHSLVNEEEITEEKLQFLSQLKILHVFHDPMANWMKSVSIGVSNVAVVGMMQPVCNSKYQLSIRFQLHFSFSFCILSISYKQEFHSISQMLSWLHSKCDYTSKSWISAC